MSTQDWGSPSFTTPESLALLWEYVRYFISAYMPYIMIVVAAFVAWAVTALIISIFAKDKSDDDDPVEFL